MQSANVQKAAVVFIFSPSLTIHDLADRLLYFAHNMQLEKLEQDKKLSAMSELG